MSATPIKTYPKELKSILERASGGDPTVLPELRKAFDESPELRRLLLGVQLEGLDRTPNDLPGRHAEGTRLGVERGPLLRRHQNHQSS